MLVASQEVTVACVLGVNSAYHEPAAAVIVDGVLVAMVEEERFSRVRHGKRAHVDNPDELPWASMEWCLQQAGIGWDDLDAIGWSLEPEARLVGNRSRQLAGVGGWGTEEGELTFHRHALRVREVFAERAPRAAFHYLPHHLCHAASAHLASPFEESAVLVVDGIGESGSTWLGWGRGGELHHLESVPFPHSLGFVWEKFSEFLGFDAYSGPGKLMGYGAVSDPLGELTGADHLSAMREIFHPDPGGTFHVDGDAFRFATDDFSGLERSFGPRRRVMVDRYEEASIAAALQRVTSDVMVHLARRLHEQVAAAVGHRVPALSMAGGVALNCVANYAVGAQGPFERLWIQPAANDAGTALGAALLLHQRLDGSRVRMDHPYLGPGYGDDALRAALREAGLSWSTPDDAPAAVARRIERGEIVAWFEGRQEVGPRALGHRSIVADPTRFDTRTRLNTRVKHRESFRPFAPSVLPRAVPRFFEVPAELLSTRAMLFTLPLRSPRDKQILPAVHQENGSTGAATSRIHLVEEDVAPRYHALIEAFDALTGVPVVLNTSFNINEPIVTSPREAVATFLRSSMDALQLGPYLVARP